jgi:hypothetical protein
MVAVAGVRIGTMGFRLGLGRAGYEDGDATVEGPY